MKIQGTKIRGLKLYSSAATVEPDSYFDLVTLLLPGNGTNGAQNNTFLDSSTNNFTVTRNGNTTQGTFSPFSQTGWSVFVNSAGSSTSTMKGLTTPNSTLFDMVNGGTVECWVYLTQYPAAGAPYFNSAFLFSFYGAALSGGSKYYGMSIVNTGALSIIRDYGGSNTDNTSSTIIPLNTWTHIAWSRISGSNYFFVNGTDITSTFTNPTLSGAWPASTTDYQLYIGLGAYLYNVYTYIGDFNGYISNFRVVKGSAVYSASFTPPTQPLTAVSGTSLLTCQSNRYIDNSTNALAITPLNTPSVQAFAPFDPATAYSTATVGGSGYFDGTGDYLTVADNTAFEFGSGDFTIEGWFYALSVASDTTIVSKWTATGTANSNSWLLFVTSGVATFWTSTNGSAVDVNISGGTVTVNSWNHIAVSRSGNTYSLYLNGTRTATTTNSNSLADVATVVAIGRYSGGTFGYMNGYISNARIVKGTAVYTGSTYTVPTTPLTAVTNTQLLLNYTNGGISDAAAKNVLETVGGAAISTAQSKFGGSSMYFDGSGDYLVAPAQAITNLTGDFTVEFWAYRPSAGNNFFYTTGDDALSSGIAIYIGNSGNNLRVYNANGVVIDAALSGISFPTSTWTHIALVRSSGVVKLFAAGSQAGSNWSSSTTFSGKVYLATEFNNGSASQTGNCYLQDFRITNGYARYTANFTPPTAAFPTQ